MSISNAQRKAYSSLATTKGRRELGLFMAQGEKCVRDTIEHFDLECLISTAFWADNHPDFNPIIAKRDELERITTLTSTPQVIAIYRIPEPLAAMPSPTDNLILALDCVQDPGNLGTIMRVADWMGITDIAASTTTADVWNPKVVQATMGAISRVHVHYLDLPAYLVDNADAPIYGTFLDGENIYRTALTPNGIVVMGNEGSGISADVAECVNRRISIPSYPPGRPTSESLNVAIATAITLSEFRRNG